MEMLVKLLPHKQRQKGERVVDFTMVSKMVSMVKTHGR